MKLLFVIHGTDHKIIETAHKKKQKLCRQMDCIADCCVYGEKDELENLSLELLGGKIYTLPVKTCVTEAISKSLHKLIREARYTAVAVADGDRAGELAALLAKAMNVKCITAVTELKREKDGIQCKKMVYNNLLSASFRLPPEFVISERLAVSGGGNERPEPLDHIALEPCQNPDYILEDTLFEERHPQVISPVLIAAGMGIKRREDIMKIREYAKCHGFSFGVSRPVAMRGWADISEIIGVSGGIYAPKVTIAIGISGAAAFMAGIEQSDYILAVNSNPSAMIAKQSDAIIADEYQNVLQPLFENLEKFTYPRHHDLSCR